MVRRFTWVASSVLLVAVFASSCTVLGIGEEGSDDTEPTATEVSQPDLDSSPTEHIEPSPTTTSEPTPAPTGTSEPTETATQPAASTPSATATAAPSATPSPTPAPNVDNPFVNAPSVDAVLENYTFSYTGVFVTDAGEPETADIFIEQSSRDRYHLRSQDEVEIWVVDGTVYFRNADDGSIFPVPSAVDSGLISPAAYLIQVPNPATIPQAQQGETEDVGGRPATHYAVLAEDFAQFEMNRDAQIIDPEGEIHVWVDQELGFVSQMTIDVEWSNEAGVRHSTDVSVMVTNVGSTPEIAAPV